MQTITLEVPVGYAAPAVLQGLGAVDNALVLTYGCEMLAYQRRPLASGVLYDHPAKERLEAELATTGQKLLEASATVEALRAAQRAATTALDAEMRGAVLRATESAAAREAGLAEELRAARADVAAVQQREAATAMRVMAEAAAAARAEAGQINEDLRCRLALLEAELAASRSQAGAAVQAEVTSLAARFDRVFSAATPSSDKGRCGEASLSTLLQRLFPEAELDDCSTTPGQGDATLTLRRSGRTVRLMVESKNVTRVRADDVTKFVRDCANRADTVDGALFASLTAETIPHKGALAFEVESGLPVLYLSAVMSNTEALRLGVEALVFAALSKPADEGSTEGPADDWADVREAVAIAFGVLMRQSSRVKLLRDSTAAVLEAISSFEGEASIAVAAINALWANRPALKRDEVTLATSSARTATAAADPIAAAVFRIRKFIDDSGRDPSRDEVVKACAVPDSILRKSGGARALIDKAKKLVL